mmetsp:Transcript_22076/g.57519  ORF Transcript_22076/g.57519 Transcript_22076/m.57519 type:complete len:345 (-) Transcript_22076:443-1477(-)
MRAVGALLPAGRNVNRARPLGLPRPHSAPFPGAAAVSGSSISQAREPRPSQTTSLAGSLRAAWRQLTARSGEMDTPRWWDDNTVAVVTGANKGIGFEIASMLAEKGIVTVVAARNAELGREAAARIAKSSGRQVSFHQLDIADAASIDAFAQWLEATYGGLSILVNNAGVAYKGSTFGAAELKVTLDTNYRGTVAVCERLKKLIHPGGRIVNMGSRAGPLRTMKDAQLRKAFEDAGSNAELEALATQFERTVANGTHAQHGWPNSMYGVSKLLEGMYTRLLATELSSAGIMVNVCCPGWCQTDMSSWRGPKTARQGADTPVWLALLPSTGPTGLMFGEREQITF